MVAPQESLIQVPTCHCEFLCSSEHVQTGPGWADGPCKGLGVAQQGITWAPPTAIVFLSSLVGVEMYFIT